MPDPDYRALCAELTTTLELTWDIKPKVIQELIDRARAALDAQPEPVAVSERLPGPEELATLVPLMQGGASLCHNECYYQQSDAIYRIADLLEQLMPQTGESTND